MLETRKFKFDRALDRRILQVWDKVVVVVAYPMSMRCQRLCGRVEPARKEVIGSNGKKMLVSNGMRFLHRLLPVLLLLLRPVGCSTTQHQTIW
jgi:hypothetical protein